MIPVTERIRQSLVSLRMARALETLDQVLGRLEKGEMTAIEAIDALLTEEMTLREGRRVGVGLRTARLLAFDINIYLKLIFAIILNMAGVSLLVVLQKKIIKIEMHLEKHHF